ncbi:DUF5777 family beta-barrel protein [Echinicola shivajiensis]|uniref:DUF5777 family beta-barrel protein n=1 Tax=Echinicola shivajiensis TaxID=1035916 RepID=UPI001BFCA228|nr:DUF5777 family beta-barrel protein [Echinicola shivajiensis]
MKTLLLILSLLLATFTAKAQLERKPAEANKDVDLIFHAPRHINLLTVEPIEKKGLHLAIMHTFGTLDGGFQNFFGLDYGANIMIGFEYGMTDKFSLGLSRSSLDKVYDLYGRYHLISQSYDNSRPISISLMAGAGVNTSDYSYIEDTEVSFADRTSYKAQIMFARKFNDCFSFQLSPMMAYFISPYEFYQLEGDENLYLSIGLSAKYKVTGKSSLTLQYIPNLNNDLKSNLGIGIDVEAGGHVFQMYFVTSQALNEQYLLAGGNGSPGEQFRLGFNVNRIFALGKR